MLADHIKYEIFNRNGKCMFCDVDMQNVNSLTNVLKEMIKESTRTSLYGHNSIMASLLTEFIMKAERYGKWSQEVRRNINSTSYKTFLELILTHFQIKIFIWTISPFGSIRNRLKSNERFRIPFSKLIPHHASNNINAFISTLNHEMQCLNPIQGLPYI